MHDSPKARTIRIGQRPDPDDAFMSDLFLQRGAAAGLVPRGVEVEFAA